MKLFRLRALVLTLLFIASFLFTLGWSILERPIQAQQVPPSIPTIALKAKDGQQVSAPNWKQITWGNLPPIEKDGWIRIPASLQQKLGYNPSRRWHKGMTPDQYIQLGDIQDSFVPQRFSLEQIGAATGISMKRLSLASFGLMRWQRLGDLVKAIPGLANQRVGQVKPIADLLLQRRRVRFPSSVTRASEAEASLLQSIPNVAIIAPSLSLHPLSFQLDDAILDWTIGDLIRNNPPVLTHSLGKLDLKRYSLASIPGLTQAPLKNFRGWQQSSIRQVPELNRVSFSSFNSIADALNLVAKADVVFGAKETGDAKVPASQYVSGGDRVGFNVPCRAGQNCPYLELTDMIKVPFLPGGVRGKRWVSGSAQKVKGGHGLLAMVNNGWEPTGRLPYGPDFGKVVLTKTDESTGTASFGVFQRVCAKSAFFDAGCTPYFIGPIPWFPVHEKGLVILAATQAPQLNVPKGIQDKIDEIKEQHTPPEPDEDNEVLDDCQGGSVSGDAVNQAIAATPAGMRRSAQKTVPLVLAAAKKYGVTDPAQVAYILSTVQTETTMGKNLEEGRGTRYRSNSSGYHGRGLVQLTHIENYRKASRLTGVDLVRNPDMAADPQLSAKILVVGMKTGMFTGRKLGDYIGGGKSNFVGARWIVNDRDKSQQMAQDAQRYLSAIQGTNIQALKESGSTCTPGGGQIPKGGPIQQRIAQAARQSYGMSSSSGPGGGNVACAWAVNRVLNRAGIRTIGSNPDRVFSVRDSLEAGRGQRITNRSQAMAGDLVLALGGGNRQHIGICQNTGCTQVLSNSSSKASFRWRSDTDFGGTYGVPSKIYRVVK